VQAFIKARSYSEIQIVIQIWNPGSGMWSILGPYLGSRNYSLMYCQYISRKRLCLACQDILENAAYALSVNGKESRNIIQHPQTNLDPL